VKLPEYVSKAEVKRVCKELGFRDWSELKEFAVTKKEAATILQIVNVKKMAIPVEEFRQGLDVELEHGIRYTDANVTNNHPILTGKIVLAHLKEMMDYYERLEVAEIEGDLLKAVIAKNLNKIEEKYKKLIRAQSLLNKVVTEQMK
jgi:DNA-binding MurR/RpiR family transcriptional regulator